MLQDNRKLNQSVSPNTAFLEELRSKLPEFFTVDKYDEAGELLEAGGFDLQKFTSMLQERNIQELTSGYKLDFIGKDYAKKQAGERPTTVILPDKEHNAKPENRDSHNLFLTGDNLEVLRHLQASYQNAVDVIYIDPPYNTGSDGFVYPDKFEYSDESLQAMFGLSEEELKRLKSIQGRANHSAWLTFMYPRLWLAKRLLKDFGVMFVSIDDNEQANLKLLMDEIFGEGQFVIDFTWQTKKAAQGMTTQTMVVNNYENILVYAKNINLFSFEGMERDVDNGFSNPDNDPRGPWKRQYLQRLGQGLPTRKLVDPETGNIFEFETPYGQEKLDNWISEGRIIFPETTNRYPIRKEFFHEYATKQQLVSTLGYYPTKATTEKLYGLFDGVKIFTNPKPDNMIFDLLRYTISSNKSAIILDFFAGSATTADAVMQLNAEDGGKRCYIMVQLPEPTFTTNSDGTEVARKGSEAAYQAGFRSIDEISRKRIELASQKIQSEKDLTDFDGGFKHYRVVSPTQQTLDDLDAIDLSNSQQLSLLEEVDFSDMVTPFSATGLGYAGSARGEETILTTWLLADGYGFDAQTEQLNLAGYQATYLDRSRLYLISSGWTSEQTKALVNCLGTHELTLQTLVIYAYSFELESLRELELALNQLDSKPELLKRY
ncbi:MAG: DNA methyltransferase [Aerococcaceae bacterium]|nr:DNA methyltransferase [Aerococcaceae bacterium]